LQKWKDYSLPWNETEYGDIKSIRIPPELMWKPDILMYNRFAVQIKLFIIKQLL